MKPITIEYNFRIATEIKERMSLSIDPVTIELVGNIPASLPPWTKLDYYRCSNCPLDIKTHSFCPLSANLVNIVRHFDTLLSYDEIDIEVITQERKISGKTKVQQAVRSLTGLVIATCGCPHTVFFKPMARFHLPLSSEKETIYRAASMYLLAQYFRQKEGKPVDFELEGLKKIYHDIQIVNYTIAERLRHASKTDSVLNAIVELDIYAQTLSFVIEESLLELRSLFQDYLEL